MPIVNLIEFEGFGLIAQWSSGVHYTNQVAGYGCEHPEIEGVFVPLFDGVGHPALYAIGQHFRGDWHPLTKRDADILDGILHRNGLAFLTVERTKLSESREAWVWVAIHDDIDSEFGPRIQGFGSQQGVLTWQNSD
jgi:hypothetical protein